MILCEQCVYYGEGEWAQCLKCREQELRATLEERVSVLERRMYELQDENDMLKQQVERQRQNIGALFTQRRKAEQARDEALAELEKAKKHA